MAKIEILKPFVLSWEGGFVNDPNDKGGATNKGVTLATYRSVFGSHKKVQDLKNMTDSQWQIIFGKFYWSRWKANNINTQAVANLLVDWVWTSGAYGIKLPQKILRVDIDGIVGPKTIAAINDYPDQHELFVKLWQERQTFFERIGKGSQARFLNGWLNRLNGIRWDKLVLNNRKIVTF